jgi:hypothetical protein
MQGRRQQRPRAERYPLHVPARARPEGHATWRDADVLNISRTGILVAVPTSFPPAATIDLEFGMTSGDRLSDVRCIGSVVREARASDGRALLAASIERYQFVQLGEPAVPAAVKGEPDA